MPKIIKRFIVLTGGPGSGKTTILSELKQRGDTASVEAGRAIIQQYLGVDGPALPWKDPALFAELMLSWELRSYGMAEQITGKVFFDRSLPDIIGYLQLSEIPVADHVQRAAKLHRYNPEVFSCRRGQKFLARTSNANKRWKKPNAPIMPW
jgi:predicted ATPase